MKTRTLLGLVFGPASLGLLLIPSIGVASEPGVAILPPKLAVAPPETAAVKVVSEPTRALPENIKLSGWLGELVKLTESGIGQDVLFSFIDGAGTFNLSADHIIYLHDIGVSSELITAMIQHDADIASGVRQATSAAPPGQLTELRLPPLPPAAPTTSTPVQSAPEPPVMNDLTVFYPADFFDDWSLADERPELSPVRKPYPVQLTAPIVVYRTQGRSPNLMLLQTFP